MSSPIKVSAVTDDKGTRSILVDIGDRVTNRRDLNQALAERYVEELQDHWRKKNRKGNKLGGKRTNFWAKAADAATVAAVTDDSATVAIGGEAGQNIRIHIFGGTIVPKFAQALTIPIVREAYNLRVREYEQKTGRDLFTIPGRSVLFEKRQRGGTESNVAATEARGRDEEGKSVGIALKARQQLRPVYILAKSAKIEADPDALPNEADLIAALQEEAEAWFDMEGGTP